MDALVKSDGNPPGPREQLLQHYHLQQEQAVHLRDYWRILLKYRWTVLTFFAIIVTIAITHTFSLTPTYRATATIKIDRERPQILSFQEVGTPPRVWYDPDFMGTQQKLLQSQSLSERVSETLMAGGQSILLRQESADAAKAKHSAAAWLTNLFSPRPSKPSEATDPTLIEAQVNAHSADALLGMLTVEPIRASSLFKISFTTPSPQLSALLANTWAKAFIDHTLDIQYTATTQAGEWLSTQLQDILGKLKQSEAKLHEFAKQKEILTIGEKKDIVTTKLADLNEALTKVQGERIAKEALYRQSQGMGFESIPVVLENPLVSNLKTEYYKLDSEYRRLSETYKPDYPKMVRIREEIAQIKRQMDTEIRRIIDAIKQEYEATGQREKLLQAAVEDQKHLAVKLNQDFIQYDILKHEVDTNRQIYTGILERQKQAGVSRGLAASNVQIVDHAKVPTGPAGPNKMRNILLGMVLGLAVGIGMAFFFDYLDNTVKSPDDLERTLGIPTLALIPSLAASTSRRALGWLPQNGRNEDQNSQPVFALVAHSDRCAIPTEAFRTLRTSLLFSSPDAPPKSILFTSAQPAEGKTGVSINTAITLSELGGSVLLIDGDMRRRSCHTPLQLPLAPGLSDYLTGNADLASVIKSTPVPDLYCIPAGTTPGNPAQLLASLRMKETIDLLNQQFDYIVVDSPPICGIADALILSTVVNGVILVVHGGRTPREMVRGAFKSLIELNAPVLGAVLNNVDTQEHGYPYSYHPHYHYNCSCQDPSADTASPPHAEPALSFAKGKDRVSVEEQTPRAWDRDKSV